MATVSSNPDLRDVAAMTAEMRLYERKIQALAVRRTEACRRHHKGPGKVTYDQLGEAMGLSAVAVYKILRGKGPGLSAKKKV